MFQDIEELIELGMAYNAETDTKSLAGCLCMKIRKQCRRDVMMFSPFST